MVQTVRIAVKYGEVEHSETGIKFPMPLRMRGMRRDMKDGVPIASRVYTKIAYALSDRSPNPPANPHYEAIHAMLPKLDTGWLVIRHHTSLVRAETYAEAVMDCTRHVEEDEPVIYQGGGGSYFTLAHRARANLCSDHLLIFVTKAQGPSKKEWEDRYHIVLPSGLTTQNAAVVAPPFEKVSQI